jgi:anthranilate phosphoribosyltransferase
VRVYRVIEAILGRLAAGEDLSMDDMAAAIDAVVAGQSTEGQTGLLLTALRAKGETGQEVAGAALSLRRHMTPLRSTRTGIVDTCGTGGDGSGTFNISTAAALVAAAAGVPVAKHGNRAVTSRTGSADALAELGVNVAAGVKQVERCLDELGICFCFAPLMHPSMKQVAEVRRKLGVPTICNLLGPLANPAAAPFQVVGVGRAELRPLVAEALMLLGTTRALVVHGEDGLDEVTLSGPTRVTEVSAGGMRNFSWTPSDFGLSPQTLESLQVDGPAGSAQKIREVLGGQPGAARDIVIVNAAAALYVAGKAAEPRACAALAAGAIDSGAASKLLERLVELSNA